MIIVQKVIIKKADKYLILLRSSKAKFFPLHWDFPGGKLDAGEDPFDGIKRELFEETGLKAEAVEMISSYQMDLDMKGEKIPHKFVVYLAKQISGDVKLSQEHLKFDWATKEEISQLDIELYMRLFLAEND